MTRRRRQPFEPLEQLLPQRLAEATPVRAVEVRRVPSRCMRVPDDRMPPDTHAIRIWQNDETPAISHVPHAVRDSFSLPGSPCRHVERNRRAFGARESFHTDNDQTLMGGGGVVRVYSRIVVRAFYALAAKVACVTLPARRQRAVSRLSEVITCIPSRLSHRCMARRIRKQSNRDWDSHSVRCRGEVVPLISDRSCQNITLHRAKLSEKPTIRRSRGIWECHRRGRARRARARRESGVHGMEVIRF